MDDVISSAEHEHESHTARLQAERKAQQDKDIDTIKRVADQDKGAVRVKAPNMLCNYVGQTEDGVVLRCELSPNHKERHKHGKYVGPLGVEDWGTEHKCSLPTDLSGVSGYVCPECKAYYKVRVKGKTEPQLVRCATGYGEECTSATCPAHGTDVLNERAAKAQPWPSMPGNIVPLEDLPSGGHGVPKYDAVNPPHYRRGPVIKGDIGSQVTQGIGKWEYVLQCIDVMRHIKDPRLATAFKYIWRVAFGGKKDPNFVGTQEESDKRDIESAIWYLQDWVSNKTD